MKEQGGNIPFQNSCAATLHSFGGRSEKRNYDDSTKETDFPEEAKSHTCIWQLAQVING